MSGEVEGDYVAAIDVLRAELDGLRAERDALRERCETLEAVAGPDVLDALDNAPALEDDPVAMAFGFTPRKEGVLIPGEPDHCHSCALKALVAWREDAVRLAARVDYAAKYALPDSDVRDDFKAALAAHRALLTPQENPDGG